MNNKYTKTNPIKIRRGKQPKKYQGKKIPQIPKTKKLREN
jgi:hypothetical protein